MKDTLRIIKIGLVLSLLFLIPSQFVEGVLGEEAPGDRFRYTDDDLKYFIEESRFIIIGTVIERNAISKPREDAGEVRDRAGRSIIELPSLPDAIDYLVKAEEVLYASEDLKKALKIVDGNPPPEIHVYSGGISPYTGFGLSKGEKYLLLLQKAYIPEETISKYKLGKDIVYFRPVSTADNPMHGGASVIFRFSSEPDQKYIKRIKAKIQALDGKASQRRGALIKALGEDPDHGDVAEGQRPLPLLRSGPSREENVSGHT